MLLVRAGVLLIIANAGYGNVAEASSSVDDLFMIAILALNSDSSGFYLAPTCIGDDARNDNKLADKVAL